MQGLNNFQWINAGTENDLRKLLKRRRLSACCMVDCGRVLQTILNLTLQDVFQLLVNISDFVFCTNCLWLGLALN